MNKIKIIRDLLDHEDNNPLELVKVGGSGIPFYVNIDYCCFNTSLAEKKGCIEEQEQELMDVLDDVNSCILIYLKFDTIEKFKEAFKNEMHWINQMSIRIERWNSIYPKLFNKIKETIDKIELESYIEKNYDSLLNMLPANPRKVELDNMNRPQLLEELSKGRITLKEADKLIADYDAKIFEANRDKLCPFSGSGSDPDRATRICSRTQNPKVIGNCATCRVASEWEECYG